MTLTASDQSQQRANLFKLFKNEHLCDVTFIVGAEREEIRTHRLLLAAISPVFEAMLFGKMKESEHNAEIEITDIDPNAFRAVLKFAYCNDPELTVDNIIAIRRICDKYQISLLSAICDRCFEGFVSSKKVCSLLAQSMNAKCDHYTNIIRTFLTKMVLTLCL